MKRRVYAAAQLRSREGGRPGDGDGLPPSPFSTKRLIVDVIRFQPGETLTEILETPATSEQVKLNKGHRSSRDWCGPWARGWGPNPRRCFPEGGPEQWSRPSAVR